MELDRDFDPDWHTWISYVRLTCSLCSKQTPWFDEADPYEWPAGWDQLLGTTICPDCTDAFYATVKPD